MTCQTTSVRILSLYFLLALAIFTIAIFCAGHVLMSTKQIHYTEIGDFGIDSLSLVPSRILVILIDGARKDFMFNNSYMPFISSCRERGAWGVSEVVSIPLSITGAYAIFQGTVINSPIALLEDYRPSALSCDNLFMRVTQQGKRVVIFGTSLCRAYGKYIDLTAFHPKHFLFSQYREEANYIFEQAYRFLKEEKWDLAVVPFYSIDHVGHLKTPLSPEYVSMLQLVDNYVRQIVDLTTDQDIVLITSEHGMDDYGFHMDRSSIVIETPFIIWGPQIIKGGPKRVLQIDWAPTLSILAGISPFYNSPALPALDLIKLSPENTTVLLEKFSYVTDRTLNSLTLKELREKRLADMRKKFSPIIAFVILAILLSAMLFAHIALFNNDTYREDIRYIVIGIFGLCLLMGVVLSLKILDYISLFLPFSANFIFSHLPGVITVLGIITILSILYPKIFGKKFSRGRRLSLLLIFIFSFLGAFLSAYPYHLLNWLILSIPLIAWGITRHPGWIVIFGSFCIGLGIRRLTFYNAYNPMIPNRWFLAVLILGIGLVLLWWRLRANPMRICICILGISILCLIPAVVIIACPCYVEIRSILLLLCFIPIFLLSKTVSEAKDVWCASWVVFFYLGTSSSIEHLTHLATFPMLIAIWSIAQRASPLVKGIMISLAIWAFYLMPGNSFNLDLMELRDGFILSSITPSYIKKTVLVIASRYIFPCFILVLGMTWSTPRVFMWSIVSTAVLPVILGIGMKLATLGITPVISSWDQIAHLIILLGYLIVLVFAFLIVVGIVQAGGLIRKCCKELG